MGPTYLAILMIVFGLLISVVVPQISLIFFLILIFLAAQEGQL